MPPIEQRITFLNDSQAFIFPLSKVLAGSHAFSSAIGSFSSHCEYGRSNGPIVPMRLAANEVPLALNANGPQRKNDSFLQM
jgi:hypothetical protein